MLEQKLKIFQPISLEEMDQLKLMDRVETKFVFSANQLPIIFEEIKSNDRVVTIDENPRPAYKIVYDDTDEMFFTMSITEEEEIDIRFGLELCRFKNHFPIAFCNS